MAFLQFVKKNGVPICLLLGWGAEWLLWRLLHDFFLKHGIISGWAARWISEIQPFIFVGLLVCLVKESFRPLIPNKIMATLSTLVSSLVALLSPCLLNFGCWELVLDIPSLRGHRLKKTQNQTSHAFLMPSTARRRSPSLVTRKEAKKPWQLAH